MKIVSIMWTTLPEWDHEYNECKKRQNKSAYHIIVPLSNNLLYLQALRLNSRGFCWYTVYHSKMRKTLTENLFMPFHLLGNASSAFTDGLGARNRQFFKALTHFCSHCEVPNKEAISDRGTNCVGAVGQLK